MGRRKIEIQPIHEERNRTVTFIKRKAGLFKKAHELAVLCQVDVAVIILGSNNTFYEFSSVDVDEMLKYYRRSDLAHDVKEPKDFGDYTKKHKINLSDRRKKRNRDDDVLQFDDSDKRMKTDVVSDSNPPLPFNNPLQQHVQQQFQSLYTTQSNPEKEEPPQRPILRVQIPNNNTSYNASYGDVIKSESSTPTSQHNGTSANPALVSRTTSSVRYEGTPTTEHMGVPSSTSSQPQHPQHHNHHHHKQNAQQQNAQQQSQQQQQHLQQHRPNTQPVQKPLHLQQHEAKGRLFSGYELPPVFSGSPAFPPYLATPLQGLPTGDPGSSMGNNGSGGGSAQAGRLRPAMMPASGGPGTMPPIPGGTVSNINNRTGPGPGPGPGPASTEYAHDLMVPSPAISSMFPDWRTNPPSAAPGGPMNQSQNEPTSANYNGSTGLTPYIMVNNTPLGNRFFNFDRPTDRSSR